MQGIGTLTICNLNSNFYDFRFFCQGPSKEEVVKKFTTLLEEYLRGDQDLVKTLEAYKEHKFPEKYSKDVVSNAFSITLGKTVAEKENMLKLMSALRKENLITSSSIQDSFKSLCNNIFEEKDEERVSVSHFLSTGVSEKLISLSDVASLTDNGAHHPLFLLVLQNLHETCGEKELTDLFNDSKINILSQLPEKDKTKERLAEILEERNLTFLYPLLRIQAELSKQLQADPNPQRFYKWIKENLLSVNCNESGFINALFTVLLKYITQEASGDDEKVVADKEKTLLESYRPILQAFLHEQSALQLVALYSLQVHFYALGFPKGQMLKWFRMLYDLEIVEEEAFLKWKEDVTDAYPGKGQALFQVISQ